MKPPRIAYCSPVNPAPSGISDYSEELLPYLAQYADITLYVEDNLRPDNPHLMHHLEVQPLRKLERTQRKTPYDAILYHIGNSPVHADIWQVAQRIPGVIVLHDFVLHHFMLWYAANVQHDINQYVRDMATRYGKEGDHVAQLMIRGRFTEAAFEFPYCEPVVAAAYGLVAHSQYVRERVTALRPTLPVGVVPMGVPLPPAIPREDARRRLGLPQDAFILASFGHINAYKRLEPMLRVLLELHSERPNTRYILVGSVSANYDVQGIIQRMGLNDVVQITGYVPRQTFEEYVAATDICINLRHPTAGETSASLLRLLGAGRPTLVSATGSFAELPAHVAAQVDVDTSERELLLAYCRLLANRPEVADALGANARRFVAHCHTLQRSAQMYALFLARLYRWPAVQRVREQPLWEPGGATLPPSVADYLHPAAGQPAPCEEQSQAEPLADMVSQVDGLPIPDIAQRLVDIGITEHHDAFLRTVAERLQEIEWAED